MNQLIVVFLFNLLFGALMSNAYAKLVNVTLIADPAVLRLSIHENKEPFINLTQQTKIKYGPSPEIPNNTDYTYLRKTVYDKLVAAQQRLPKGMYFCLYEGYRSLALQKQLFVTHYQHIKRQHPDWSDKELFDETTKLVSPVQNQDGSKNIPPHSTGGAIDVYLIDKHGNPLDMGIHPKDWMKDKEGALSLTESRIISSEAIKHRQIMSEVLKSEGFVNYPTEYWHWSYGDRYWAFIKKQPYAIYGTDKPKTSLGSNDDVSKTDVDAQ